MTTEDYGNADLVFSTIRLLLPVFTMQITSAVMRFSIEKKDDSKPFYNNGLSIIVLGFIALLFFIPVFSHFHLFDGYLYLFYILYITNALYLLLSYYARALEKIKLVGILGTINTLIVVFSNIIFLVVLKKGIMGYLLSYILGYLICIIMYLIAIRKNVTFRVFNIEKKSAKEMLRYSIPLVPNDVSWWGVNSANKYVIYGYINQNILGLYSVALKIPSIINIIQGIIAEALVLSILEEYNNDNKDEKYFSLLYRLYSFNIVVITSLIIIMTKVLSHFLFAKQFYNAWIFVPLLCIPPVWGSLSGYLGTFYSATKNNKGMFLSTALGGIITIVISLLTVNRYGVYGIMIGNIISYFVIWLYRWIDIKKFVTLDVKLYIDIICWFILLCQALVVIFIDRQLLMYTINFILLLLILLINRQTATLIIKKIKKIIINRKQKKSNRGE